MKKGVLLILCLMLLAAAVLPVMAAGSAYMGLSASAATVYREIPLPSASICPMTRWLAGVLLC